MKIPFIKMHGLGNDFVVLDNRQYEVPFDSDFMRKISDRRWGVGCDQVIILDESKSCDVFMHIFNQDGSKAGACGNATRCVASLIVNENNTDKCIIETISGNLDCVKIGDDICVNMGIPKTDWKSIPLSHEMDTMAVEVAGYKGICVNMGNPHIVIVVDDAEKIDVAGIGVQIEHSDIFPERTNVEFISKIDEKSVRMRVWERGGMITSACGSGACAVFVASNILGICDNELTVKLDGGNLNMSFAENGGVLMLGGYTTSFKGEFYFG